MNQKKNFKFLFICAAALVIFVIAPFKSEASGSLGNGNGGEWESRQEIQINPQKVAGDLENFPALITHKNMDEQIFTEALDSGCDIRFSLSANKSAPEEIAFELVSFDKADKTTEIWVNLPFLDSNSTTSIWIWWGNNSAVCYLKDHAFGSYNVWDEHYKGVWHLGESGSGIINEFKDSTRHNNHGIGGNGSSTKTPNQTISKIGKGQNFDGLNDFIEIADDPSLDLSTSASFSFIFNSNDLHDYRILSKNSVGMSDGYAFDTLSKKLRFVGCGTTAETNYILSTNKYYFGNFIFKSPGVNKQHFFINGEKIEDESLSDSIYINNLPLRIGAAASHESNFFNGVLDEIRILNIALSSNWILTEFNNQNSPETFAVEQEVQDVGAPAYEDFSFAHLTDIHLGSSWIPGHSWSEELSYPRFTDALFEIGWELEEKPDLILVSGDAVERAKTRWLKDYESIIQAFTTQSGIPVYTVPGNHDRYRRATGSYFCQIYGVDNCDDGLSKYQKFLSLPESNLGSNGIDYEFTHKGMQFIGLDSGSDFMPDYELTDLIGDIGIEGGGLSNDQISALENLDSASPKILFMHHPVFTGAIDDYENGSLEDASFANNRSSFLDWASASGLQLVLAGHTHRTGIFDIESTEYMDLSAAHSRPLFIKTQSATHDAELGHGYRLVFVQEGLANPEEAVETGGYNKLISRLYTDNLLNLRVYDPLIPGHYITLDDTKGLSVPFFIASSSKKAIVYNPSSANSKFQVIGNDLPVKGRYDLEIRNEDQEIASDNGKDFGFKSDFQNKSFINYRLNDKLAKFDLEDFTVKPDNLHEIILDWNKIAGNQITDGIKIKNIDGGTVREAVFTPMKDSIIARLASPAELRIINSSGSTTGLMDEQILENIDYSMFDNENNRVLLYFPDGYNNEEFIFRVKGLLSEDFKYPGNDYALQIDLKIDNEIVKQVKINNLPINASTTHQFRVDWERLDEYSGVIMEIDKDGDGIFEQKVYLGETIELFNPRKTREQIIADLESRKNGQSSADDKLESVIDLIRNGLNDDYWLDDYHLSQSQGKTVFDLDKRALRLIRLYLGLDKVFKDKFLVPDFVKDKFVLPDDVGPALEEAMEKIALINYILVKISVNDLPEEIKPANIQLLKAEQELNDNYLKSVQHSENAWRILSAINAQ